MRRIIHENGKTLIEIGTISEAAARHLFQGKKETGFYWKDGQISPWVWDSIVDRDGIKFIMCDEIDLIPLSAITTAARSHAFSHVRNFAQALQQIPQEQLAIIHGYMPLWNIYISKDSILILPPQLSRMFETALEDADRYQELECWIKHPAPTEQTLALQCTELLYFAATGTAPYAPQEVRASGFNHVPLSVINQTYSINLSNKAIDWIDYDLLRPRKKHESSDQKTALNSWLRESSQLQWDTDNRTENPGFMGKQAPENSTLIATLEQRRKQATRKHFFRTKGMIILAVLIALAVVTSLVIDQIKDRQAPPYTAGMSQEEIIEEYYRAQSNLEPDNLSASLARNVKSPVSSEVSNLYVVRQMRMGYEGINTVIPADTWVASGMPAIAESSYVYGVTNIHIVPIGENSWSVTSTLYAPYDLYESTGEESLENLPYGEAHTYVQIQEFDFIKKKDWWLISQIRVISHTPQEIIQVETYPIESRPVMYLP